MPQAIKVAHAEEGPDFRPRRKEGWLLAQLAGLRPAGQATARSAGAPGAVGSAPAVVTLTQHPQSLPHAALEIPRDRDVLIRELQKELRRVGCYEGELNGVWTHTTRRAMKTFTDRVNASLPVDEPDAILFAMVQGQQDPVCGQPCPAGQGLSRDGLCLPDAILAKAARATPPVPVEVHRSDGASAIKRVASIADLADDRGGGLAPSLRGCLDCETVPSASAPEGRMGLAGPLDDARPANVERGRPTAKPYQRGRTAAGRGCNATRPALPPGRRAALLRKRFSSVSIPVCRAVPSRPLHPHPGRLRDKVSVTGVDLRSRLPGGIPRSDRPVGANCIWIFAILPAR